MKLTDRQSGVLAFIRQELAHGRSPTLLEIAQSFGGNKPSDAQCVVDRLVKLSLLRKVKDGRKNRLELIEPGAAPDVAGTPPTQSELHPKHQAVVDFVRSHIREHHVEPTIAAIGKHLGKRPSELYERMTIMRERKLLKFKTVDGAKLVGLSTEPWSERALCRDIVREHGGQRRGPSRADTREQNEEDDLPSADTATHPPQGQHWKGRTIDPCDPVTKADLGPIFARLGELVARVETLEDGAAKPAQRPGTRLDALQWVRRLWLNSVSPAQFSEALNAEITKLLPAKPALLRRQK